MAEALVSSVLEQLTSIISQEIQQEVTLVVGVEKQLKQLTYNLRAIQDVLVDAEQKQLKEARVRCWVDQLKDTSYDMEDVLDEWKTAMMKLKIEGVPKEVVCFPFPTFCFCFMQVRFRHDIALKIKERNENLDEIAKSKDMFNFSVIRSIEEPQRVPSVSFGDESDIRGRVEEKDTLISKLLCESSQQQEGLRIISIVGMGGIGKTTLAQLVYNDNKVIDHFKKRMWVCVSEPFDEFRIAKAIIEALEGSATNLGEFQSLLQRIETSISGKRFLLVLDDVWTEDYDKWQPFKHCLKNGLYGSKILVTTRKETSAQIMESSDIINIKELSKQECWSLFKRLAFSGWPPSESEKLEEIGQKIVDKCKGLPLAAKTIGGLLRFKRSREEWQNILNSEMWRIEDFEKDLLPPLLLSYNDLPSKIKHCFSYCAVFRKDDIIEKNELIRLWMAQGYIEDKGIKEMEKIGEEYFDYLAARSLFQEFEKDDVDNVVACKMHDIVHDFAQFLRKNDCISIEIDGNEELLINSASLEKVRHSILVLGRSDSFPVSIFTARKLRSLLIFGRFDTCPPALRRVFDELTCLRALRIDGDYIGVYLSGKADVVDEIPKGIEKLIHLRYLKLSGLKIKELPESCCELYNLQTLDIQGCSKLRSLPQRIGKLINLRHLKSDVYGFDSMPKGIGRLTCLRTLNDFVVSGGKQCNLECLKHLNHLRGSLTIRGLENVTDVDEAKNAELEKKKNLSQLELNFGKAEKAIVEVDHEAIIEALRPNPDIERLKIYGYRGKISLPSWLMSLTNLKILNLHDCINCENMPPLGKLSSLEEINISNMKSVKRVGGEFLGIESDDAISSASSSPVTTFPKLKTLTLIGMDEWEGWDLGNPSSGKEDIIIMPSLKSLEILLCPQLKSLPDQILRSKTLEALKISCCTILEERFKKETGEDWHKISHIPCIILNLGYIQGGQPYCPTGMVRQKISHIQRGRPYCPIGMASQKISDI